MYVCMYVMLQAMYDLVFSVCEILLYSIKHISFLYFVSIKKYYYLLYYYIDFDLELEPDLNLKHDIDSSLCPDFNFDPDLDIGPSLNFDFGPYLDLDIESDLNFDLLKDPI